MTNTIEHRDLAETVSVRMRPTADGRIRAGHLWVFSNELQDGFQRCRPGDLVELLDAGDRFLGLGTVNPHSLIAVRLLTRKRQPLDGEFFRKRIHAAAGLRQRVYGPDDTAHRLIYSESEGLPGLIVDRFGDVLVIQSLTAGMENLLHVLLPVIKDELRPRAIILANDSPMRELEGLPLSREVAFGSVDSPVSFDQDGIRFLADPVAGQKTGFFFDQRLNRRLVREYVRDGYTVLDLFSYTGAFGLYAVHAGASHVTFVDDSEKALTLARECAEMNGWGSRSAFLKQDIFPWLSQWNESYDMIIVDPPALAKSRSKVNSALRAYRDLNARAIGSVKPGGLLATSSCSGLVSLSSWREAVREAARKAGKRVRILAQGAQAPDHPILLAMPETEYLKFLVAIVD